MMTAAYIIAGLVLLLVSAEAMIRGAVALAERFNISKMIIGLTIVALGTSAPELVVSVTSSLQGYGDIALGNIIGSNIANIALILGVSALIFPLAVSGAILKRELVLLVLVTGLFTALCFSGQISQTDGLILLGILAVYTAYIIRAAIKGTGDVAVEEVEGNLSLPRAIAYSVFGIIFLAIGANILVQGAVEFATSFGIPESIIGVTILALGSSLPELATCASGALRKQTDLVVGNVVGSNLLNILFAISIPATITPISVNPAFLQLDALVMIGITIFLALILWTRKNISRISGAVLLIAYIVYLQQLTIHMPS